jgi:uncharacterized membrane protein YeaQ/YmgE (transglycosylase-associated protein family)
MAPPVVNVVNAVNVVDVVDVVNVVNVANARTTGSVPSMRMGILGWIVVGLVAGGIARWIVKDEHTGCIYTMVVGVLGAIVGGGLMSLIDAEGVDEFSFRSIGVGELGAFPFLLVLSAIDR